MPVELNITESVTELDTTVVTVTLESASEPGPAGPGVAAGGTVGQVLTKDSSTDFDTSWQDPTGGPGSVDAADVTFTPSGTIAATDTQAAVEEVATDADSALTTHSADTTAVHGITDTSALALTANHPSNATFNDHSARHENGGADEISIAGLDGTPTELTNHLNDTSAAHAASAISADSTTLVGTGTDVQAVLEELDNGIADHIADAAAAHAATAISFTPDGSISATTVQAAIVEVRDEAGGGGAPTDVDYLVGTASGGLSSEIVVGTSPGGELGGTWASPTVDATHSGSSHAAVQAAAEATAAGALATHEADTTSVHGITNTANLALTADVVTKALYDANTVLAADSDNTPAAVTMAASTILARLAAGNIKAASVSEIRTLLDVPTNAEAILDTLFAAKGDLITATANDTPAILTVGTDGHVLTADSGQAAGIKWAAAAGGGTGTVQLAPGAATLPDGSSGNAAPGLTRSQGTESNPKKHYLILQFDGAGSTAEYAWWDFIVPADYASGGTLDIYWEANATSNAVKWQARVGAVTPDDADTPLEHASASAATVTTNVNTTEARRLTKSTITLTMDSAAAGDLLILTIFRDPSDGSDTSTADANLIYAVFKYTK